MKNEEKNLSERIPQENRNAIAGPAFPGSSLLKLIPVSHHPVSDKDLAAIVAETVEKERRLIGQELHDNVNQVLTTVLLFMDMLQPADGGDEAIKGQVVQQVKAAIEEIRRISKGLVADTSTGKPLPRTIEE